MAIPCEPAGFHHPLVRAARLLQQKKHRQRRRCFLLEGATLIEEALDAGARLLSVFLLSKPDPHIEMLAARAADAGRATYRVDERTMESLSQMKSPPGIVAVCEFVDRDIADLCAVASSSGPVVILVLDDISDPGNAGTLIRSANAFGAAAVCLGARGVDPYNDKMVRATMGALFRTPILRYDDWSDFKAQADRVRLRVIAAQAGASDVRTVTSLDRVALLVGNERAGLTAVPPADIATLVGIPQTRGAESLNAAVAGSLVLYEIARRVGTLTGRGVGAAEVLK
ncbi:MAG: RNA methyltransferase [Candidatus Eremiobacteraeota bacterium]|nr:RNA methyltransferase [Candidatus Eremiobacteraeota bacterium]MBC5826992.1 RNA methyltransferase [Candidatus Eremiobacteraeota bacterium]